MRLYYACREKRKELISLRNCTAAGQGRAGQGRAGQGRAGQGRAGQGRVTSGSACKGLLFSSQKFRTL